MAFIPVVDTVLIELVYSLGGQIMENTMHFSGNEVDDPSVLTALAANAYACWQSTFRTKQVDALKCEFVRATSLMSDSSPSVVYNSTGDNTGDIVGDPLPYNCAMLLQLVTPYRGRSWRGRLYIPGLAESYQSNSVWSSAEVTNFENFYGTWEFLDVAGEPYALVVCSRYHNGVPRPTGQINKVSSWKGGNVVASQRRRLPGRGV